MRALKPARIIVAACLAALPVLLGGSRGLAAERKPSILFFVFDTTRADAVSAYGPARGTTPELDRLAASGLRYTHAYANAPWTLPSHVTMFTGLLMHEHGVGSRGVSLPNTMPTLAERLRDAGYETASFSENPFITEIFNMMRGFEHRDNNLRSQANTDIRHPQPGEYHVVERVQAWLQQRKDRRPFFLFVNVMNAHAPYGESPATQLPAGVSLDQARRVKRDVHERICSALPPAEEIEVLKALYHDGVAADDAKLKALHAALQSAGVAEGMITLVTSDHGEHFGEHRLMEHNFSVRNPLLQVPLVVSGLAHVKPAVLAQPVQMADLMPTILAWAGAEVPPGLSGKPLPSDPTAALAVRPFVAHYTEPDHITPTGNEPRWLLDAKGKTNVTRAVCSPQDRVHGDLMAVLRYPYKVIWYDRHPAQIYDLAKDPGELTDLAPTRPDLVKLFRSDIETLAPKRAKVVAPAATVPPEVQERLRLLGYGDTAPAKTAAPSAAPR